MKGSTERAQDQEAQCRRRVEKIFNRRLAAIIGLTGRTRRRATFLWRLTEKGSTWYGVLYQGQPVECVVDHDGFWEFKATGRRHYHYDGTDWEIRVNDQLMSSRAEFLDLIAVRQRQIECELPGNE